MSGNRVIPIFQSKVVVSSEAANNAQCVFERRRVGEDRRRTGTYGGHSREDEVFPVLEGQLEFYADGEWVPFAQGETRISLRGNWHGFRNVGSAAGRMLAWTNGGGIDESIAAISSLKILEDRERLTEISNYFGYYYLPPRENGEK